MAGYREHLPAPGLAAVVACTWERSGPANGPVEARVLPDACADLVWTSSGGLFVAGPDTGPVLHRLTGEFRAVGLRMRPGTAGAVLGLPLNELRDLRVPLEELWGREAVRLADALEAAPGPDDRRALLERAVGPMVASAPLDPLVLGAIPLLGRQGSRVTDACRALAVSERQLRRRFDRAVGYGPKTLHRVLRFRGFLERVREGAPGGDGLAAVAAGLGYADQPHLTRECRALAGLTPAELAP